MPNKKANPNCPDCVEPMLLHEGNTENRTDYYCESCKKTHGYRLKMINGVPTSQLIAVEA